MNALVEHLNRLGGLLPPFMWSMGWQSSLLVVVIFALDFGLRRKARAAVRYALWLIVMVKLVLPPALALPTSPAWWLLPGKPPQPAHRPARVFVSFPESEMPAPVKSVPASRGEPPPPRLTGPALLVAGASCVCCALLVWLLIRWFQISGVVRRARMPAENLRAALGEACRLAGMQATVRLRVTAREMSPAVCGLFQPVILLPETLAEKLPANQLRAVLLHELIHLRRRDVWINCLQTLLQIAYWWHPLVWFANARIRRIREEAVDDAVMLALNDEADCYAPTLLEVAKLAFHRPLASLGLVGILESRSALRQRIERLMDFQVPRRAGLSFVSILGIAAFTVLAVPMGEAPSPPNGIAPVAVNAPQVVVTNRAWAHADGFDWQIGNIAMPASVSTNEPLSVFVSKAPPSMLDTNVTRISRRFNLDMDRVLPLLGLATNSLTGKNLPDFLARFVDYFKSRGVDLRPPNNVFFHSDGRTWVHTTAANMQKIEAIIVTNSWSKPISVTTNGVAIRRAAISDTNEPSPLNPLSVGNPASVHHSDGRQAIMNKLYQIRLDSVSFDAMPLSEVVRNLSETAKQRDPEGRGINFLTYIGDSVAAKIDPATGLPIATLESFTQAANEEVGAVRISIKPALRDVRLADVLDAVVSVADRPIKYSIENYAVEFSLKGAESAPLSSRRFRVDPAKFIYDLKGWTGLDLEELRRIMRRNLLTSNNFAFPAQSDFMDFFQVLGVDLSPPKGFFFSVTRGELWVHATTEDLEVIEIAIQRMSINDPQVEIHTKFINLPAELADKLWEKWLPTRSAGTEAWSVVLSTEQVKTLVNDLHGKAGVQEIADGRLTTLSGRQTQFQAADLPSPSVNSKTSAMVTLPHENASAIPFPPGLTLDTIAYVSADGYTIQMTVVPTLLLKAGIDESNSFIISTQASGGKTNSGASNATVLPLPHFRTLQVPVSAVLFDGQTLVIHAPKQISTTETNGTQATMELPSGSGSRQLILVTPRLIDAAGNDIHPDEELKSMPVINL